MNSVERHARKQVLLARIAFSRNELRRDIAQVKHAAEPAQLMRSVVGDSVGSTLSRWFGGGDHPGRTSAGDWFGTAMAWLSRYRMASTLLGSVLPMLGGGRGLRRLLKIAAVVGTGWLGWRTLSSRRRPP
jgi:hypothetical protein